MMPTGKFVLALLACLSAFTAHTQPKSFLLESSDFKHYVDSFNLNDEELYKGLYDNSQAWDFMKNNIPFLDCPDKTIEKTYYFRWWTYRKHIKKTPVGFIISEFHPDVEWAGKYNAISCPGGHQYAEGRWLRDQKYLNAYTNYWFREGGSVRSYSFWVAKSVYDQYEVTGDKSVIENYFDDIIANYQGWEKERLDKNGLFWQIDDRDGMEVSIGGSGYRATINSYLFGDAVAIAKMAKIIGKDSIATQYMEKANAIKTSTIAKLWDSKDLFFKVLPQKENASLSDALELHGYTPWYVNMPGNEHNEAWKYLMDPNYFYAPYGPTSAQQTHKGFKIAYEGHECQWNGPSWPFATTITLKAMSNLLNNYQQDHVTNHDYYTLLYNYAYSHRRVKENGKVVSWIDENLNPFTGDWISRTLLKQRGNFIERGKDYNHSGFCDLVISGLIGLQPQSNNEVIVNPLIPQNKWSYFCLDNVNYHGKTLTIVYDKTGEKYKKGIGLMVFANGKKIASSKSLSKIRFNLK